MSPAHCYGDANKCHTHTKWFHPQKTLGNISFKQKVEQFSWLYDSSHPLTFTVSLGGGGMGGSTS